MAWTSPANVAPLLGRAASAPGRIARDALDSGHALWVHMLSSLSAPEPVLFAGEKEGQPYPFPLPGQEAVTTDSLLEALLRSSTAGTGNLHPVPASWSAAAEHRVERARRKASSLARRLASAAEPADLRARGDLILARYQEVPRGAQNVTLMDFEGRPLEIPLDPALSPHENASRYYQRAARAQRAGERLPGLVDQAKKDLVRAEALLERIRSGAADPEEVRRALPAADSALRQKGKGALPYLRYRSSGGLEIRVGKNARSNDLLTFRDASPEDIWLHARDAGGAHVILRWSGEANPPAKDLVEAAVLAALHSKSRTSGSVPVDWTRRKYVRKPRKAPAGTVVPERVRTVFVEPDRRVAERLRRLEGE